MEYNDHLWIRENYPVFDYEPFTYFYLKCVKCGSVANGNFVKTSFPFKTGVENCLEIQKLKAIKGIIE